MLKTNIFGVGVRVTDADAFYSFVAETDRTLEARFIHNQFISDPTEPPPTDPTNSNVPSWPNFGTSPAQPPVDRTPTPTPIPPPASIADALYKLGLFVGTGTDAEGKPIFELERQPTRLEALALIIRLMGLEKDAFAFTGANRFTDVPGWGERYAAYGYHIGITVGVNDERTLFAPNRQVTAHEFTTFLLRVLGYSEQMEISDMKKRCLKPLISDSSVHLVSQKFQRTTSFVITLFMQWLIPY